MTYKQLSSVETKSPLLVEFTSTVWYGLIQKDFPDRPLYEKNLTSIMKGNNSDMVPEGTNANKQLYMKYLEERELFRLDSAKRLRKMQEMLQKEKSSKSIIPLPNIADPGAKRRKLFGTTNNDILKKARKDVDKRTLMFPGVKKNDGKVVKTNVGLSVSSVYFERLDRPLKRPTRVRTKPGKIIETSGVVPQISNSLPTHLNEGTSRSPPIASSNSSVSPRRNIPKSFARTITATISSPTTTKSTPIGPIASPPAPRTNTTPSIFAPPKRNNSSIFINKPRSSAAVITRPKKVESNIINKVNDRYERFNNRGEDTTIERKNTKTFYEEYKPAKRLKSSIFSR